MPSCAARAASSSGENAPSFIEKYERTSRWTKPCWSVMPRRFAGASSGLRPDVREALRHVREQGAVSLRILAQERGPMRAVERPAPEPRRKEPAPAELRLREDLTSGSERDDLLEDRVAMAAADPLPADRDAVARERLVVAPPHLDGRVMPPAVVRDVLRAQHLQRLDPLLAEAAVVEDARGPLEARVRQEGLHRRSEG